MLRSINNTIMLAIVTLGVIVSFCVTQAQDGTVGAPISFSAGAGYIALQAVTINTNGQACLPLRCRPSLQLLQGIYFA